MDRSGRSSHTGAVGEVHRLPVRGRRFFLDDTGHALRATWHHDRSLVNLSVWRDDRCTAAFQLSTEDAARLVAFLAEGLAAAVGRGERSAVDHMGADPSRLDRLRSAWRTTTARLTLPRARR